MTPEFRFSLVCVGTKRGHFVRHNPNARPGMTPKPDALSYPLRAEGKSSFVDSFDATVGVLADGRVFSFHRLGLSGVFTLFLRFFSTFREKNDAMRRFFEADRKNHLV